VKVLCFVAEKHKVTHRTHSRPPDVRICLQPVAETLNEVGSSVALNEDTHN
jgi:hypothetical protein